ncbi:lysine exporter LysO family protein [Proteinivorax hydrogeniformans]|uniref:Lysine exporter LysO family protein n=1 Tax=Proteinivorax hydrogeniformans TaxID=1826727 RepID=A0AAU8HW75_9FIRM
MLLILLTVLLGFFLAFLLKKECKKIINLGITLALIGLLFSMGVALGNDENILANFSQIGVKAFIIALATISGSILALWLVNLKVRFNLSKPSTEPKSAKPSYQGLKLIVYIFIALALGIAVGAFDPAGIAGFIERTGMVFLYILLLLIGYDLYNNKETLQSIKKEGLKPLLIPISIAFGSIASMLPLIIILPLNFFELGAVASGFGWYSLSSVIISQSYSSYLGMVALLSNIIREVLALIITPLVPKFFPKIVAIAPAGATAMDTLLPIVIKSTHVGITPMSILTGTILSTLVYILVPFFLMFL